MLCCSHHLNNCDPSLSWPEIKLLPRLQIYPCRLHSGGGARTCRPYFWALCQAQPTGNNKKPLQPHQGPGMSPFFSPVYFNRQPLPEGLFLLSTPNMLCHILTGRPLSHQVSPLNLYHNSSKCFSARSPGGYLLRTSQDPCCAMGK